MQNELLNSATWEYVRLHADDDVRQLALRGCKIPGVDLTRALQQIQGRQTARRKLPSWAALDGIVYPPHLNMEQCSSEPTARYKAKIIDDLQRKTVNRRLLDLTGGFGADFAFMSEGFTEAVYVERNEELCAIAAHNFRLLGLDNVTTVCADAETAPPSILPPPSTLHSPPSTLIYLDPARRDTNGAARIVNGKLVNRKYFALADCTPNVITMMPGLLARADHVMLKLSPMLDWRKAIADLAPHHVSQVHIVAVDNECKELLLLLTNQGTGEQDGDNESNVSHKPPLLTCTDIHSNDNSCTVYSPLTPHLSPLTSHPLPLTPGGGSAPAFLYSPNAAVMKAGCFSELYADLGIAQLSANSHLFCSDRLIEGFPGRCFRIQASCSMNKRELRATLGHLSQANIAVRNFPLTAEQLRRRLRLADGGSNYIFATTLTDNSHRLFLCNMISRQ